MVRPLWGLATGVAIGSAGAFFSPVTGSTGWYWGVGVAGVCLALLGARARHAAVWWVAAGVLLGLARGLPARAAALVVDRLSQEDAAAIRVTAVVTDGWRPTRWGLRTNVRVESASRAGDHVPLTGRHQLEVRGDVTDDLLPTPGTRLTTLAAPRGPPHRVRLVASSALLLDVDGPPSGLHAARDRLAQKVVTAAGSDVRHIRAAELACALVVGRRDLLPEGRLDGWRRSGLAHMLAVSGLHVGLVGGVVWLVALAAGARVRTARLAVLMALPAYAVLAGAPPSALRAALMGMVYLTARLAGRALRPMAAVLLAATGLLLAQPSLVVDAGFQLTVLITAALVRWVPTITARLPGPQWITGAVAVPVVAQLAALPLVILHFRTLVPGAVGANLLAPVLLAPLLVFAGAAALAASTWAPMAVPALEVVSLLECLLWRVGVIGRSAARVTAQPEGWWIALICIAGWLALQPTRRSRMGAVTWLTAAALAVVLPVTITGRRDPEVTLLEVPEGLAALVADGRDTILVDGGRGRDAAARHLVDLGVRHLDLVVATHTDVDHVEGLVRVVEVADCAVLAIPAWARSDPALAPLVRRAVRRGVSVRSVTRGSVLRAGRTAVEVLWPPARQPAHPENERSLVMRVSVRGDGRVLVPADIGSATERRLASISSLGADVLVAPHHGSRGSTSDRLLEATSPTVVLIPAGPYTTHGHPHDETLGRLARRGVDIRWPGRDGRCGARSTADGWVAFP
jgi:competence protein ComEC